MLRKQLLRGIHEVISAIEDSGVTNLLRRPTSKDSPGKLLSALRAYSISAHAFSDEGRQVANVFELERLEDAEVWIRLLSESEETMLLRTRLQFILRNLPEVIDLLTQDSVVEKSESVDGQLTVLQIRLIEDHGRFSTVNRVIQALAACQELYDALATLEDDFSQPLAIGAIDSGSDKAFDLFGAAKVMSELRQLILSVWDLVVFHRERKLGRQLELIASALPILERIQKLEDSQKLGREQAQIIRNSIVDGTKKFLDSGVTLEEFNSRGHIDPRLLLAPEQKLLSAPPIHSQAGIGTGSPPSNPQTSNRNVSSEEPSLKPTLSDEDLRRLAELLGKRSLDGSDSGST